MNICNKLCKRGLALFMALVLCLSLLPATALAEALEEANHTCNADGWICTKATVCGKTEHSHDDGNCVYAPCALDEHDHDAEGCVWDEEANAWSCGKEQHSHADDVCILEEHTHKEGECYFPATHTAPGEGVSRFLNVMAELDAADAEAVAHARSVYESLTEADQDNYAVVNAETALAAVEAALAEAGEIPEEVRAFVDAVNQLPYPDTLEDMTEEETRAFLAPYSDVLEVVKAGYAFVDAAVQADPAAPWLTEEVQMAYALAAFWVGVNLMAEGKVDNEDALRQAVERGGEVKLDSDITLTSTLTINGDVTLDLNGHTLFCENSFSGDNMIVVQANSALTITDGSDTKAGVISGDGRNNIVYVLDNGSLILEGGTLRGASGTRGVIVGTWDHNGWANNDYARFTMTGGTIADCDKSTGTRDAGAGGGVCVRHGEMKMTGGRIENCKATYGGGIALADTGNQNNTDFEMTGGTITGCTADNTGGGISTNRKEGDTWQQCKVTIVLLGSAEISGNTASNNEGDDSNNKWLGGGGIFTDWYSRVEVHENAKITGNTSACGGGIRTDVLIMDGGEISGNTLTAARDGINVGGGVLIRSGTPTVGLNTYSKITGGKIVNNNNNNGQGNAVYVCGDGPNSSQRATLMLKGAWVGAFMADASSANLYTLDGETLKDENSVPEHVIGYAGTWNWRGIDEPKNTLTKQECTVELGGLYIGGNLILPVIDTTVGKWTLENVTKTYTVDGTPVTGEGLTKLSFSFKLTDKDGSSKTYSGTVGADGKVTFPYIDLPVGNDATDTTATAAYILEEVVPEAKDGITYDESRYQVTVMSKKVTTSSDGWNDARNWEKQSIEIKKLDASDQPEGNALDNVTFANTKTTAKPELVVTKYIASIGNQTFENTTESQARAAEAKAHVGDVITWGIYVKNNGTAASQATTVTDIFTVEGTSTTIALKMNGSELEKDAHGNYVVPIEGLAIGAEKTYTVAYTVQKDDTSVQNVAVIGEGAPSTTPEITVEKLKITGITKTMTGNDVTVSADTENVTLSYAITVTGEAGAAFEVSDPDAALDTSDGKTSLVTPVAGKTSTWSGTIPTGADSVTIYVTKTFSVKDGKVVGENGSVLNAVGNTATVTPGDNAELPEGTEGNKLESTATAYQVMYQYDKEYTGVTLPELPKTVIYPRGTTGISTAEDVTLSGYKFSGWSTDDVTVTEGKFNLPYSNVVFVGSFTKAPVIDKVEKDFQGVVVKGENDVESPETPKATAVTNGQKLQYTVTITPTDASGDISTIKIEDSKMAEIVGVKVGNDVLTKAATTGFAENDAKEYLGGEVANDVATIMLKTAATAGQVIVITYNYTVGANEKPTPGAADGPNSGKDVISNTATITVSGPGGSDGPKETTKEVPYETPEVTVTKDVFKIMHDTTEVTDARATTTTDGEKTETTYTVNPGDTIIWKITVTNEKNVPTGHKTLKDELKVNETGKTSDLKWLKATENSETHEVSFGDGGTNPTTTGYSLNANGDKAEFYASYTVPARSEQVLDGKTIANAVYKDPNGTTPDDISTVTVAEPTVGEWSVKVRKDYHIDGELVADNSTTTSDQFVFGISEVTNNGALVVNDTSRTITGSGTVELKCALPTSETENTASKEYYISENYNANNQTGIKYDAAYYKVTVQSAYDPDTNSWKLAATDDLKVEKCPVSPLIPANKDKVKWENYSYNGTTTPLLFTNTLEHIPAINVTKTDGDTTDAKVYVKDEKITYIITIAPKANNQGKMKHFSIVDPLLPDDAEEITVKVGSGDAVLADGTVKEVTAKTENTVTTKTLTFELKTATTDTVTVSYKYTVTAADVAAGKVENTAHVVTYNTESDRSGNDDGEETVKTGAPGFTIEKKAYQMVADEANSGWAKRVEIGSTDKVPVGTEVTYEITVTNTGDVPLSGIELTDVMSYEDVAGSKVVKNDFANLKGASWKMNGGNKVLTEAGHPILVVDGTLAAPITDPTGKVINSDETTTTITYTYTVLSGDANKTLSNVVATTTPGGPDKPTDPVDVPVDTLKITGITKTLVEMPEGWAAMTTEQKQTAVETAKEIYKVELKKDENVTLLYKITVKGDVGATFTIIDESTNATLGAESGTIGKNPDGTAKDFVTYATMTVSYDQAQTGAVANTAAAAGTDDTDPTSKEDAETLYLVSYEFDGTQPTSVTDAMLPASALYKAEATVTVAPGIDATGYTFTGWAYGGPTKEIIQITNGTFEMPEHRVILKGGFTLNAPEIEKDDNGKSVVTKTITAVDTVVDGNGTVTTDKNATAVTNDQIVHYSVSFKLASDSGDVTSMAIEDTIGQTKLDLKDATVTPAATWDAVKGRFVFTDPVKAGATVTVTYTYTVNGKGNVGGKITNKAEVTLYNDSGSDRGIGTTEIDYGRATLVVNKNVKTIGGVDYIVGATAKTGDEIVWTITVYNRTNVPYARLSLTDVLNFDGTAKKNGTGSDVTAAITPPDGIDPTNFTVPGGETVTFTATYTVKAEDAGQTIQNVVTVKNSSDVLAGGNSSEEIPVVEYTLTTTADDHSTIDDGQKYPYDATETITVNFSANAEGYVINTVTVDGTALDDTALDDTALATAIQNGSVTVDKKSDHSVVVTSALRTDLSYTVNYLEQGTNRVLATAKTVNGQTFGVDVKENAIAINGYSVVGRTRQTITIAVDGNVINFYYVYNGVPVIPTFPDLTPTYPNNPAGPTTGGTTIADEETPLGGSVGLNDTDHFAYVIGYEDDTVRPLNNITRAEAATIFFRLMTDEYRQANWSTTNSFTDVNAGDWYNNAVSTCANAGVLKGYDDGTFRPNAPITRAEFASMAAGFMDESITDDGTGDFSDTASHWAAAAIRRAAKAGWVTGTGSKFNPDARITRAEVMTIVNRMLDRTPDKDHMLPEMKKWTDNPESEWYYEAVQEATNEHDYERDDLNVETWTELLTVRDWKALETEWANNGGASAPKADVESVGAEGESK